MHTTHGSGGGGAGGGVLATYVWRAVVRDVPTRACRACAFENPESSGRMRGGGIPPGHAHSRCTNPHAPRTTAYHEAYHDAVGGVRRPTCPLATSSEPRRTVAGSLFLADSVFLLVVTNQGALVLQHPAAATKPCQSWNSIARLSDNERHHQSKEARVEGRWCIGPLRR